MSGKRRIWSLHTGRWAQAEVPMMDWQSGSGSQDAHPAGHHKGYHFHGYYREEQPVHADDGTILGYLRTEAPSARPEATSVVWGKLDLVRDDMVRAMRDGAQL
jgi:hypothetical protein